MFMCLCNLSLIIKHQIPLACKYEAPMNCLFPLICILVSLECNQSLLEWSKDRRQAKAYFCMYS